MLKECLRLSSDEKIQVKLLEPILKNIRLNKSNIIEFDANKKEKITIKYTIDNPTEQEIEFY